MLKLFCVVSPHYAEDVGAISTRFLYSYGHKEVQVFEREIVVDNRAIFTVPVRYVFDGSDSVRVFVDAWDPDFPVSFAFANIPADVKLAHNGSSGDVVIGEAVVNLGTVSSSEVILSFGKVLNKVSDDEFYGLFSG